MNYGLLSVACDSSIWLRWQAEDGTQKQDQKGKQELGKDKICSEPDTACSLEQVEVLWTELGAADGREEGSKAQNPLWEWSIQNRRSVFVNDGAALQIALKLMSAFRRVHVIPTRSCFGGAPFTNPLKLEWTEAPTRFSQASLRVY